VREGEREGRRRERVEGYLHACMRGSWFMGLVL